MFYESLREVCRSKGTSPSAVCLALNMSKSNVTKWKQGRWPKLNTAVQIAEHLDVPLASLIPEEREDV